MKECLKKNKMLLFLTIMFSVISSGLLVFSSILLQRVIDVATNGDIEAFKRIIIYFIGYTILIAVFLQIYGVASKLFIRKVLKRLRRKTFQGIISRNYKDFGDRNTADYISVLTNDIKLVEENYILPLLITLQNGVMFIGSVVLLFIYSPIVTIILFITMAIAFIIPGILGGLLEKKQKKLSDKLSLFTSKIKDIFSGYDVIRTFNLSTSIKADFEVENEILTKTKYNTDLVVTINETISNILGATSQFVAIFVASYLVIKGDLTVGILVAIIQLSGMLVGPLMMIMNNFPKVKSMKAIMERIDEFINYEDEDFKGEIVPSFNRELKVRNLSFAYDDKKEILNNINLKIDKNKKYAIVGESGCGKSTLIKLLLGYYSKYSGQVEYDENEIGNLDIKALNTMISIIHQNVYMFDKTIEDNILLYNEFSKNDLERALDLSGVDKFINDIKEGLRAKVGENGSNLSGGQRQRIAIARALIRKTPVLVLDEGTSAIDMQTAYDIERELLNINDLTLITITHKMSEEFLSLYDEIIYMAHGEIREIGSLNALLNKDGEFKKFYTLG